MANILAVITLGCMVAGLLVSERERRSLFELKEKEPMKNSKRNLSFGIYAVGIVSLVASAVLQVLALA